MLRPVIRMQVIGHYGRASVTGAVKQLPAASTHDGRRNAPLLLELARALFGALLSARPRGASAALGQQQQPWERGPRAGQ
jgi:hypothetical protein